MIGRVLGDLGYNLTDIEHPRTFPFHVLAK
jgi:hypothetical protein